MAVSRMECGAFDGLKEVVVYLNRTCVLRVEVDYGLSAAGNLNLVLRAEPCHDYIVAPSVSHMWHKQVCTHPMAAHL
jgi:hypothetical protein